MADAKQEFGLKVKGEYKLSRLSNIVMRNAYHWLLEAIWLQAKTYTISSKACNVFYSANFGPVAWASIVRKRLLAECQRVAGELAQSIATNTKVGQLLTLLFPLTEVDYKAEEKKHKQRQHAADAGALAAGAFALHEKHAAKKHPEQRHAHKVREHVAAAIAIGAGTLTVHEKHERKHAKKQQRAAHNTNYNVKH
ncbi:hypothetical protein L7F22_067011 [Adiantum nelumboides]|nr:hypothetical protein [Adiantum nelumboides]